MAVFQKMLGLALLCLVVGHMQRGWTMDDSATADAVADMRVRIDELSTDSPGQFLNYDGREMPW